MALLLLESGAGNALLKEDGGRLLDQDGPTFQNMASAGGGYALPPSAPAPLPALGFNNGADRLYRNSLPVDNTAYTVAMWIRRKSTTADPSIIYESDAAGTTYDLALNSNVLGILNSGGGFTWTAQQSSALTADVWYFIALTINGTTGITYQGDRTTAVVSSSGTIGTQAASYRLNLGAGGGNNNAMTADVALIRLWNAVLTSAEVEAERTSATPVRSTSLTADWRLASDASKLTDSSGNGNALTAAGAGPWSETDGPILGADSVVGVSLKTLGTGGCVASGIYGSTNPTGDIIATLQGVTSVGTGRLLVTGTSIRTLGGVASAGVGDVGQAPIDWAVGMPRISTGKSIYGTGVPSRGSDDVYGYIDTPGAWAMGAASWLAINVGSGPSSVLVALSNDNASGGSWITDSFAEYRLQVSSDSTNGADGTWTTVVTVTGNGYLAREHKFSFTGYSWVKLIVDAAAQGQLDEFDIWDASNGTPDTFAFLGDSITDSALRRSEYVGGGYQPSFQRNVRTINPGHYPLQIGLGQTGQGASYWATNIATALAAYPDVKYWCLCIGVNDGGDMPSGITTWRSNMTTIINAITADGRVPVIGRTTWTNAAGYGGGDYSTCGLRYLNDNGVDYLASTLGVRKGPDLFALFYANGTAYAVDSGNPHPNEAGYKAWTLAWAQSFGVASSNVTGTSAVTLANLASSAAGTVTAITSGASAVTLANLASSASGTFTPATITGSSAVTLANLTSSGTGAHSVAGASTVTLANITSVGAGTVVGTVTGVSSVTIANITSAASGTVLGAVTGTSAVALANITSVSSGVHSITGASARTLANLASAATGTFTPATITGTSAVTLANITSAASGTVLGVVAGSSAVTLASITSAAAGTVIGVTGGTSIVALAGIASSATGAHGAAGTSILALGGVSSSSTGVVRVIGTSSTALDGVASVGSGAVVLPLVTGTSAQTFAGVTSVATGARGAQGAAVSTLDDGLLDADGTWSPPALIYGGSFLDLDDMTATGAGMVPFFVYRGVLPGELAFAAVDVEETFADVVTLDALGFVQ